MKNKFLEAISNCIIVNSAHVEEIDSDTAEPDQVPDIGKMVERPEAAEPDKGNAVEEGKYYWVRCFEKDDYEPAQARDRYGKGTMYFCFTNGSVVECKSAFAYEPLSQSTQRIKELEEALRDIKKYSNAGKIARNNSHIADMVDKALTQNNH